MSCSLVGYWTQAAFSVNVAEIVQGKEQQSGEGTEEEGFWGHRLGQEATQAAHKMFSSAVFEGT